MPARPAELELTFLERTPDHTWEFGVTPDPRFDRLIKAMAWVETYNIRFITYTPGSGHYQYGKGYGISSEGLWVVAHLFRNYSEMREKLRDPEWRIFEVPYQECEQCHRSVSDGWTCFICQKTLCGFCRIARHTHIHERRPPTAEEQQQDSRTEQEHIVLCDACGSPTLQVQPCLHCGKQVCMSCYTLHKAQARQHTSYAGFGSSTFDYTINFDTGPGYSHFWENLFGSQSQQQQQRQQAGSTTHHVPSVSQEVREAFRTLGLASTTATKAEITKAYRKLAAQHHPDKPTGDSEKMKQVNRARDVALAYAQGK